jgi:hypothetical protein
MEKTSYYIEEGKIAEVPYYKTIREAVKSFARP